MLKEYLFLYNMVQWGGWGMILLDLIQNQGVSEYGASLVNIFQLIALLEVVHAATRMVRASPSTTLIQVFGRLQVLAVRFYVFEAEKSSGNLPMMLAWALVEIVRYLYLGLNVVGFAPFPLLWLRYSLFYVLYPLGVYGEMKVLYDALPGLDRTSLWSKTLPNDANFSFSFANYIRVFLVVAYIPGLVNQYTYMMRQRKTVLARDTKNE